MAKSIPAAEFKLAVKALNAVLKEADEPVIKLVGSKKEQVMEDFTNVILDYIENEKAEELPDEVIKFYNTYIVADDADADDADVDDADADEEKPKKKSATKSKEKAAPKEKKSATKSKEKAAPKERKPGIVLLSIDAYMEHGCKTANEIVDHIQSNFPDRNINKTVSHCFGILKHIKPNK